MCEGVDVYHTGHNWQTRAVSSLLWVFLLSDLWKGSIVPDVPWRICRNRVPVSVDRVRVREGGWGCVGGRRGGVEGEREGGLGSGVV